MAPSRVAPSRVAASVLSLGYIRSIRSIHSIRSIRHINIADVTVAASALSLEMGHKRKATFYLLEAARRYMDNMQWQAAHEVRASCYVSCNGYSGYSGCIGYSVYSGYNMQWRAAPEVRA